MIGTVALSRYVARSGTRPVYQKMSETDPYVPTANTSQMSGLRKFGHSVITFGYGKSQYAASHGRPVWRIGNIAAHATAKSVIASADRLIDVRQSCLKRSRMAEISVPAWPIPIHQTKLMIGNAQPTGMLVPQMPMPLRKRYTTDTVRTVTSVKPTNMNTNHAIGVFFVRTMKVSLSAIVRYEWPGPMSAGGILTSPEGYSVCCTGAPVSIRP